MNNCERVLIENCIRTLRWRVYEQKQVLKDVSVAFPEAFLKSIVDELNSFENRLRNEMEQPVRINFPGRN